MSYSKIREALETVLPGAVYETQAPAEDATGKPILEYLVYSPTGSRFIYADGHPFATVYNAVVTVAAQSDASTLPERTIAALGEAHVAMAPAEHSYDDETATYYTDIPCEVI